MERARPLSVRRIVLAASHESLRPDLALMLSLTLVAPTPMERRTTLTSAKTPRLPCWPVWCQQLVDPTALHSTAIAGLERLLDPFHRKATHFFIGLRKESLSGFGDIPPAVHGIFLPRSAVFPYFVGTINNVPTLQGESLELQNGERVFAHR